MDPFGEFLWDPCRQIYRSSHGFLMDQVFGWDSHCHVFVAKAVSHPVSFQPSKGNEEGFHIPPKNGGKGKYGKSTLKSDGWEEE